MRAPWSMLTPSMSDYCIHGAVSHAVAWQDLGSNQTDGVAAGCNRVVSLEVPLIDPHFSCGLVQTGPYTCSAGAGPANS